MTRRSQFRTPRSTAWILDHLPGPWRFRRWLMANTPLRYLTVARWRDDPTCEWRTYTVGEMVEDGEGDPEAA